MRAKVSGEFSGQIFPSAQRYQRHIHVDILTGEVIMHRGGQLLAGVDGKSHIQPLIQWGAGWLQLGKLRRILAVVEQPKYRIAAVIYRGKAPVGIKGDPSHAFMLDLRHHKFDRLLVCRNEEDKVESRAFSLGYSLARLEDDFVPRLLGEESR